MKLSPFKFHRPSIFGKTTHLYRSLDEALLECSSWDFLYVVPTGHAPVPYQTNVNREPSPLRELLGSWPWKLKQTYRFQDGRTSVRYIAAFDSFQNAFAFAELKTQQAKRNRDSEEYHVCLWAVAEDGRTPEIACLPANHLSALRRARDRQHRRAARAA